MENNSLVRAFNNTTINTNLTVIKINDQIWFIAKEVAEALEYSSIQMALHSVKDKYVKTLSYNECKEIFRLIKPINLTLQSMTQGLRLINKSGLIQLTLNSTKPEADAFQDWVLEDVIPSVLENGSYGVPQISQHDQLLLKLAHAETPEERILVHNELYQLEHKTELKRSMTAIGKLGGITTARNIAIKERDEAREQLIIKQEELDTVNDLYNELKDTIGEGDKWQSSAQLMQNYPDKFRTFKSPSALTRYLKKRSVEWKLSDHSDKTGFYYAIFDVEQALTII